MPNTATVKPIHSQIGTIMSLVLKLQPKSCMLGRGEKNWTIPPQRRNVVVVSPTDTACKPSALRCLDDLQYRPGRLATPHPCSTIPAYYEDVNRSGNVSCHDDATGIHRRDAEDAEILGILCVLCVSAVQSSDLLRYATIRMRGGVIYGFYRRGSACCCRCSRPASCSCWWVERLPWCAGCCCWPEAGSRRPKLPRKGRTDAPGDHAGFGSASRTALQPRAW